MPTHPLYIYSSLFHCQGSDLTMGHAENVLVPLVEY